MKPLPRSFRINRLKADVKEVLKRFDNYGIVCYPVPWYDEAFITESDEITYTLEHFLGMIYMQELSSMLPVLLLKEELKKAHRVLDACAAPGSKTTHLAAMMNNRGLIVANDRNFDRIKGLKFNLNKTGTLNTVITQYDLIDFPDDQFDIVLLDAPCSSEGTIRKNPYLFTRWTEHRLRTYAGRQRQLILKAFDLLVPGGVLVYATCTFAPEENEAIMDWLLKNRPAEMIPVDIPGIRLSPPVTEWEGRKFDDRCRLAARLWPHHNDTGGFFIARVSK